MLFKQTRLVADRSTASVLSLVHARRSLFSLQQHLSHRSTRLIVSESQLTVSPRYFNLITATAVLGSTRAYTSSSSPKRYSAAQGSGSGSKVANHTSKELEAMTTTQLRGLLREYGIPVSGRKADLVDRILSYTHQHHAQGHKTVVANGSTKNQGDVIKAAKVGEVKPEQNRRLFEERQQWDHLASPSPAQTSSAKAGTPVHSIPKTNGATGGGHASRPSDKEQSTKAIAHERDQLKARQENHEREVKAKLEKERLASEKLEKERLAKEKQEKELKELKELKARQEKEQHERELKARREKEQHERELKAKQEKEQHERELKAKQEKERLAKEKHEKEQREIKARQEKEQHERELKAKHEKEQQEIKAKHERERLAKEKHENEQRELKAKQEKEQHERELKARHEKEQLAKEKHEKEQLELKAKHEKERLAKEQHVKEQHVKEQRELKAKQEKEQHERELKAKHEKEVKAKQEKEQHERELKAKHDNELKANYHKEVQEKERHLKAAALATEQEALRAKKITDERLKEADRRAEKEYAAKSGAASSNDKQTKDGHREKWAEEKIPIGTKVAGVVLGLGIVAWFLSGKRDRWVEAQAKAAEERRRRFAGETAEEVLKEELKAQEKDKDHNDINRLS